ncbi:MAG: heme-binding domain-containing protein [Gemmatimonadota bacterium]
MRRVRVRQAAGALLLIAGVIQLIRPTRPAPGASEYGTMTSHIATPPDVEALLVGACYDCHSAQTEWPWYSWIAPFSWWIVEDVRHARSNLDFSDWSTDPNREPTPTQRLRWSCEEVRENVMPPLPYRLMHPEARLTRGEKDLLCDWVADALAELR